MRWRHLHPPMKHEDSNLWPFPKMTGYPRTNGYGFTTLPISLVVDEMSCGCLWNVFWLFSAKPCVDCRFDSCDSTIFPQICWATIITKDFRKKKTKQDIRNLLWTFSTSPLIFQMLTSCSDFFYRGLAVTSIHWHDAIIHYIVGNRNLTRKVAKDQVEWSHHHPWSQSSLGSCDSLGPRRLHGHDDLFKASDCHPECRKEDELWN